MTPTVQPVDVRYSTFYLIETTKWPVHPHKDTDQHCKFENAL